MEALSRVACFAGGEARAGQVTTEWATEPGMVHRQRGVSLANEAKDAETGVEP